VLPPHTREAIKLSIKDSIKEAPKKAVRALDIQKNIAQAMTAMIQKYEKTPHEIMYPPEKISSTDARIREAAELETIASALQQTSEGENYQADRDLMDLDIEEIGIHPAHKEHIENIKKLLEKEPKLKEEVKKIIVDQLVKAKIKPDQYKELNQEIENLKIATEAPQSRRRSAKKEVKAEELLEKLVKVKKPRGKKGIESAAPVDHSQKPVKETYKNKKKVIRLD
jgi:hypothetical protein